MSYTKREFCRFDLLTIKASSPNQLTRIEGRLALKAFVDKVGKAKCDEMWAVIKKRDNLGRAATP